MQLAVWSNPVCDAKFLEASAAGSGLVVALAQPASTRFLVSQYSVLLLFLKIRQRRVFGVEPSGRIMMHAVAVARVLSNGHTTKDGNT